MERFLCRIKLYLTLMTLIPLGRIMKSKVVFLRNFSFSAVPKFGFIVFILRTYIYNKIATVWVFLDKNCFNYLDAEILNLLHF